ncbi:MAG: SMP-30/gluconolactonase/LRE family protein [Anaerolineales bacterium]|nr:SMP-30/gluconolactonase/LRE family protein [Anaerolineales bacterium]
MNVEIIYDAKAVLGEGPAWSANMQTLYWVDILEKKIYADTELFAELDDFIGCVAPCKNGHMIVGKRASVIDFEPATSQQTTLYTLTESANTRVNDGKCDPAGRFIFGTMDMNEKESKGSLYAWDGKQVNPLIRGVTISNGLAWSPNHKILYYIDTPTRQVKAYDYDVKTGQIANMRVVINVPKSLGWPDGMTSDMQGNLWVAMWGGAQVTKWNPNTGDLLVANFCACFTTNFLCVWRKKYERIIYHICSAWHE